MDRGARASQGHLAGSGTLSRFHGFPQGPGSARIGQTRPAARIASRDSPIKAGVRAAAQEVIAWERIA